MTAKLFCACGSLDCLKCLIVVEEFVVLQAELLCEPCVLLPHVFAHEITLACPRHFWIEKRSRRVQPASPSLAESESASLCACRELSLLCSCFVFRRREPREISPIGGVVRHRWSGNRTSVTDDVCDLLCHCRDEVSVVRNDVVRFARVGSQVVKLRLGLAVRHDQFPMTVGDREPAFGLMTDQRQSFVFRGGVEQD